MVRRLSNSLRSRQRESRNQNDSHNRNSALSPSTAKSPVMSGSPSGGRSANEERRYLSWLLMFHLLNILILIFQQFNVLIC